MGLKLLISKLLKIVFINLARLQIHNRITPTAVTETYFEDVTPETGNNFYMVKSLKLSYVASGSY